MGTIQRTVAPVAVRVSLVRYAVVGVALGLARGAALRGWMRYINDSPEFTWRGTGFVLGAAAIAGLGLGLVEAARRAGRSSTWRLAGLLGMGVFAGAGAIMLPTALLGGLALSGRSHHPAVRIVAGILALAPAILVLGDLERARTR